MQQKLRTPDTVFKDLKISWQTAPKAFVSFLGLVELVSLCTVSNRCKLEGSREGWKYWAGELLLLCQTEQSPIPAQHPAQAGESLSLQNLRCTEMATMSFVGSLRLFWWCLIIIWPWDLIEHLIMQFTDAGHKMEHQHIQICVVKEFSGFLQCCKKSCMFSFSWETCPTAAKPALIPSPLNLHKWGLCVWVLNLLIWQTWFDKI